MVMVMVMVVVVVVVVVVGRVGMQGIGRLQMRVAATAALKPLRYEALVFRVFQ
jgi:hypothetical protein